MGTLAANPVGKMSADDGANEYRVSEIEADVKTLKSDMLQVETNLNMLVCVLLNYE